MSSPTSTILVDLLKKTIKPTTKVIIPTDFQAKTFYKLAVSHGISGLLYYPCKEITGIQPELMKKLEDDCLQTVARSSDQQYHLQIVKEALNLHSMNHVLMKGELLRRIYPYPDMRLMGDVDILVNQEDLPQIHDIMKNIGFLFVSESENHHVFVKSSLMIEFHPKLMPSKHTVYDEFFQSAFEHIVKIEESTYQFTYEYHLVYLIAHIAKHFKSQGSGIRSIFDIAVYIHTYDYLIDYEKVRSYLKAIGLGLFFDTIYTLVKHWFGVTSNHYEVVHEIDAKTMEEMAEFVIQCGTYGYSEDHIGDAVSVGIEASNNNTSIKKGRLRYLIRLVFPKPNALKYKYKTLEKYPYLVPWFWFVRILELIFKKKNKKRRMKNVFTKDQDIKQIMNLYQKIGLL